jgi:hypothetical protein
MTMTRQQAVHTYVSTFEGQTYLFDVVVDSRGLLAVRNLRNSFGPIMDAYTSLPDQVVTDISNARGIVAQQLLESTVIAATVAFDGTSTEDVLFPPGTVNTADYRVVYTTLDGTPIQTTNKTALGFTAEAPTVLGDSLNPVVVDYTVLVAVQPTSAMSGTVTFTPASNGLATVNFPAAMQTADYRVILSPDGFFPIRVSTRTKTKFTLQLGYTLAVGETVTVGYDVFV